VNGVLVVDKPQGPTSHDVVAVARRCLRESRIGHTGTLDPMATGVLPLACGAATRLVRFLSASEKHYDATIRFGQTTDTYDATGTVVSRTERQPSQPQVEDALRSMIGDHLQMPPPFSAKKVGGRRAYDLARRAEPVVLQPVPVRLSSAALVEFNGETARIRLVCSAGFYVRSFAHALGEQLGTGACLEALRRTRSGAFGLDDAVTLEELQRDPAAAARRVIPPGRLLPELPGATLTDVGRTRVSHGQDVYPGHLRPDDARSIAPAAEWVRLLDADGRLLALAQPVPGGPPGRPPRALHPSVVLI